MQIFFYLVVLVIVGQTPVELKFKDFDTFANGANLQNQMSCKEFIKSKDKNTFSKKYFKIREKGRFEYICLTPDQLQEWLISVQKYNDTNEEKKQGKEEAIQEPNRIVLRDAAKVYTGYLRYRESNGRKTVESYSFTSFYLEIGEGKRITLPLRPSQEIDFDKLKTFIGKKVLISAEYIEELPDPNESYPMEMSPDGKSNPMTRKYNSVISISQAK